MKTQIPNHLKNVLLLLMVSALGLSVQAQETRNQHPNASGLSATAQSIPGMSRAQREGLKNPEQGTLVYQTDNAVGYYMNEGTPGQPRWTPVSFGGQMPAPEAVNNGSRAPLSGERGFLPPRLTDAQMNAIAGPAEGLLIYNLTQHKVCMYLNSVWDCTVFCKTPDAPSSITGAGNDICGGTSQSYSTSAVSGATDYTWSYTGSGTPVSTTTSCTFIVTSPGTLSVTANNNCGASAPCNLVITVDGVTGADGRCWADRNLGASQVATSGTDADAYGDLYQWGRSTDGHQSRTSATTTTLSSTDDPGHGNFIVAPDWPYNWRSPYNDNLWQGLSGINNPCAAGYRIPTIAEWTTERDSWTDFYTAGAFGSPLKLTGAGRRNAQNGALEYVDELGSYHSSTTEGNYTKYVYFGGSNGDIGIVWRAMGVSVRCIKD